MLTVSRMSLRAVL